MKKVLAIAAVALSIVLLALAVLFLIAAMVKPERLLVAIGLFVAGALPLVWAIATLRRQAELSPENLSAAILALASQSGGEVTEAQVQARFRIPQQKAADALERLGAAGQVRREVRGDRVVYVVQGLKPSLVVRRCPYCGSSFPVREAIRSCPNCGATVELDKT
jgi:ribosomal protein S27AE